MKAIIDIETGGYSIEKNGVCEIACLIVNDEIEIVAQFSSLIKPYERPKHLQETPYQLISYKEDAMGVNGIKIEQLDSAPSVEYVITSLCEFMLVHQVNEIIGHCVEEFDLPRLRHLNERFGYHSYPFSGEWRKPICTMKLAKEKAPHSESYSLEHLCARFKITNLHPHRAMGDCMATLELYKKLIA